MELSELVREKREDILRLAARHGAHSVRLFGSVGRGEAGPDSDVDFLVEMWMVHSPWFPGGLVADLEDLLGRRVDVVTEGCLHPRIRARVLEEAKPL